MIAVFSCYIYFEFQSLAFVALLQAHDASWNDPSETIMVCQAENMPFFLEHPRNKSISVFQIMLCHGRGLDCKGTSNLYAFLQPFESNTIIITTRVGWAFGNSSIKLHIIQSKSCK